MADIYNSNNVPHSVPNGAMPFFNPDGSALGTYIMESFTPNYPTATVQRADQVGGAGGFAIAANAQATASATIQIATNATPWPEAGCYFDVDTGETGGAERWVIQTRSKPYQVDAYWTCQIELLKDHFATLS